MKKHLCIVAAAALAVGGIAPAWAQQTDRDTTQGDNVLERAADRTGDALRNTAERTRDALGGDRDRDALTATPNAEEIHDLLAQVTEAALTKGGLDDMVERFVDADRNRLGQNQDALKDNEILDGRIQQFQNDWKAKYNQDFDINDEDQVYGQGFAMISEGEIGDTARTAGERLEVDARRVGEDRTVTGNVGEVRGDATVNPDAGTARVDVDNDTGLDAPRANTDGQTAADRNRNDPGRNVATVTIMASHGQPQLQVPLIHEAGGWKIDIPDHVDAQKLHDNLLNHLTFKGEKASEWPSDVNEAYRAVTHHVLAAIFDKEPGEGARTAGEQLSPDQPQQQQDQSQPLQQPSQQQQPQ